MDLRSELLKSIWYGFTALDLERSGKVSKSQLKVSQLCFLTQCCIVSCIGSTSGLAVWKKNFTI